MFGGARIWKGECLGGDSVWGGGEGEHKEDTYVHDL